MEAFREIWTAMLGLEAALGPLAAAHGDGVYAALWMVLFAETGFVVTGFLPGDTLLFAAAALAASGALSVWTLLAVGLTAAFAGDMLNFALGRWLGRTASFARLSRLLRPGHLELANRYFARHGPMAIVLARFVPMLRFVAPLAGGIAAMPWGTFIAYNALGKLPWAVVYVAGGYFLGRIPWFSAHFSAVVPAAALFPLLVAGLRLALGRLAGKKTSP